MKTTLAEAPLWCYRYKGPQEISLGKESLLALGHTEVPVLFLSAPQKVGVARVSLQSGDVQLPEWSLVGCGQLHKQSMDANIAESHLWTIPCLSCKGLDPRT